jgi:hypothetical protein
LNVIARGVGIRSSRDLHLADLAGEIKKTHQWSEKGCKGKRKRFLETRQTNLADDEGTIDDADGSDGTQNVFALLRDTGDDDDENDEANGEQRNTADSNNTKAENNVGDAPVRSAASLKRQRKKQKLAAQNPIGSESASNSSSSSSPTSLPASSTTSASIT